MKNTNKLSHEQLMLLQQAERIALSLDKAIQSEEISDESVEKAQIRLNKIYKSLEKNEESIGEKFYIIYEAQSLIAWIEEDKDETRNLLTMALDTNKDGGLLTESANDLLESLNITNNNSSSVRLVHKWTGKALVALIIGCIIVVMVGYDILTSIVTIYPYLLVKPSLFASKVIPTLIWLLIGVLLIRYGKRKAVVN